MLPMILENTQLLLGVVVILVTLTVIVGLQAFLALRDMRKTLEKTNKVLDEADELLEDVGLPIRDIASTFQGLRTVGKITSFLFGTQRGKKITKELSLHGKEVLSKVEELVEEVEGSGNGHRKPIIIKHGQEVEHVGASTLLSAGKRLFKGVPKKR